MPPSKRRLKTLRHTNKRRFRRGCRRGKAMQRRPNRPAQTAVVFRRQNALQWRVATRCPLKLRKIALRKLRIPRSLLFLFHRRPLRHRRPLQEQRRGRCLCKKPQCNKKVHRCFFFKLPAAWAAFAKMFESLLSWPFLLLWLLHVTAAAYGTKGTKTATALSKKDFSMHLTF